jgi:hypothetical protein
MLASNSALTESDSGSGVGVPVSSSTRTRSALARLTSVSVRGDLEAPRSISLMVAWFTPLA